VGLVDDLDGLWAKDIFVPAPVVATEEKVSASGQHDTNVRLSAAAIAAVGCAQSGCGQCRGHMPGTSLVTSNTPVRVLS
jgi:hypothetical protein